MNKQLTHNFGRNLISSLMITSGLVAGNLGATNALATEAFSADRSSESRSTVSPEPIGQAPLVDGVYLYGEASEPEQIGSAYMVMQVNGNQVVGAFYLPYSSFDCFQGEFQGDQLHLTVVNSYDQTAQDYSLAVHSENYIASIGDPVNAPARLNGFHTIDNVSDNDQRMLETCKADFQ